LNHHHRGSDYGALRLRVRADGALEDVDVPRLTAIMGEVWQQYRLQQIVRSSNDFVVTIREPIRGAALLFGSMLGLLSSSSLSLQNKD
jgi:hypothetical protein